MTSDLVDKLRRVPLFASLDDVGLAHVGGIAAEFEVSAGHIFMERGQPGNGVFIIEEGTVRVDLPSGDVVERGAGQFFGELSVLADTQRTARVSASTDVRCIAISRRDLLALLEERSDIALAMLREVATRLAEMTRP